VCGRGDGRERKHHRAWGTDTAHFVPAPIQSGLLDSPGCIQTPVTSGPLQRSLLADAIERAVASPEERGLSRRISRGLLSQKSMSNLRGRAPVATALRGLVPQAVQQLLSRYPGLGVDTRELEPDDALPQVVRGDVDVAIVDSWLNSPLVLPEGVTRSELQVDAVDIALPASHPLAMNATIDLRLLSDE